jgi:biotin transport system substrate-specific component
LSDKTKPNSYKNRIKIYVLISLLTALIAVCSFVTIPSAIPFTLQTFGIFTALLMLGGKYGTISVCLYIVIGILGVPVFSGFSGGIGHLLGATGGYITGFALTCFAYWLITSLFGNKLIINAVGLTVGLLLCYIFGTLWYTVVFIGTLTLKSFSDAFIICVIPFIIPDFVKITIALLIKHKTANVKQFNIN